MTDDPTERRLRATLQDQADRVDSHLSGPDLRRRAATRDRTTGRVRRFAPVLATAAGVAAIAIAAAVISTNGSSDEDRAPVQPGGQTTATSSTPAPSPTPPSSTAAPSTSVLSPTLVVPSASTGITPSPTSVPRTTPVASPSIVRPPRSTATP